MWIVVAFIMACIAKEPVLDLAFDAEQGGITFLGWDTEGGARASRNLLQNPIGLFSDGTDGEVRLSAHILNTDTAKARFHGTGAGWDVHWSAHSENGGLRIHVECLAVPAEPFASLRIIFPFDPRITPTTVLPALWDEEGMLHLPAIVSAPDHGQMLLSCDGDSPVRGHLTGSRTQKKVDLHIELPLFKTGDACTLSFAPVHLPAPHHLADKALWTCARRGWFGAFQCSAEWGDPGHPYSAPSGMLGNNVISDPASCSLWFYADQAFFTPDLAPGISAMALVRRTLDWWLDHKVLPHGEMICYWDKVNFLDANSGPIIAAWDYVEATGDLDWLKRRIERIELLADYLAGRDTDGDGLVEAVQSGNYGALQQPGRSCAWWDALNCGHKDSYSNALIYRAWRCLADLEAKLGRSEAQARYTRLADRLHAAFFPTLYNPATGWLAWWKSEDGVLHDYASPIINGMAIEYGLVPQDQIVPILDRLWNKITEAGFTRFDLGVPPMLIPVLRADYLQPDAIGIPQREDGTDTFGYYMNGGITAGQVLHFLAAHYVAGENERGDRVLRAMLDRQAEGGFQNGAVNAYPQGIDWTTWDGQPAGYEGYLADSFRFLQAVLLREAPFRQKLYRPLMLFGEVSEGAEHSQK
jgi:hypothetical protein